MQNRLSKRSYFIKRLRDSGYKIDRIFSGYGVSDPRMWTIVINPVDASIFCTCYINHGETDGVDTDTRYFFEIYDGGQFVPGRLKIDTSSIEVFIDKLMKLGIEPMYKNTKVSVND